jgi:hypothetical protein
MWLRRFRTEILLAVTAGLVALGAAEGLTRWLAPYVRDHVVPGGLFTSDDLLGWKLRANGRVFHRTDAFAVEYAIDAAGFRDRSRVAAKAPGTRRVLAYGDSHLFGWGVPADARFTDLVEADLPGVEIWNRGVPGYGLDQEILSYERDGDVAADDVLLWVSPSTLERTHYGTMYRKAKPRLVLGARGETTLQPPRVTLFETVYPWVGGLYLPYLVERWLLAEDAVPARPSAGDEAFDALGSALLARALRVAEARHHRFLVLSTLPEGAAAALARFCAAHRVALFALDVPFGGELALGPRDRHWNARGHRRVADALRAQLERRGG